MTKLTTALAQCGTTLVLIANLVGCETGPQTCSARRQQAEDLVASYQACERDDDCMVASTGGQCLAPFLCSRALRRDTDLDALRSMAQELSDAYREHCPDCVVADCVDPSTLSAGCVDKLCAIRN